MEDLGINIPSLVVFLVNFSLVLGVLYLFAFKPVLRLLDQRAETIRNSLTAADQAKKDASDSEAKIQEQFADARREGQRLLDQARGQVEEFRQSEMGRARSEAEELVVRAREEIVREKEGAVEEIKNHFADLTIQAAEKVINRSLDQDGHRKLISEILEDGERERKG